MRAIADLGITNVTSTVIATRGERLALTRTRYSGRDQGPEAFRTDALPSSRSTPTSGSRRSSVRPRRHRRRLRRARCPVPRRRSGRPRAHVVGHRQDYAAFNRHELPRRADWVTIDHRRLATFESSDLTATIRAMWDLTPDLSIHIEAVHRLSDFGAVVTHAAHGTSQEGFDAEWRKIDLSRSKATGSTVAKSSTRQTSTPRSPDSTNCNRKRRGWKTRQAKWRALQAHFAARDWDAMAEILADDFPLTIAVGWWARESARSRSPDREHASDRRPRYRRT